MQFFFEINSFIFFLIIGAVNVRQFILYILERCNQELVQKYNTAFTIIYFVTIAWWVVVMIMRIWFR